MHTANLQTVSLPSVELFYLARSSLILSKCSEGIFASKIIFFQFHPLCSLQYILTHTVEFIVPSFKRSQRE